MHRIYFATLALVSMAASAAEPYEARFVKQWDAHCKAPFGAYELSFRSASGDATNDDMTMSIKSGTGSRVPVPLKPALFFSGRLKSNSRSQCDKLSTVSFPSGRTLLLVQRDDRPSENRVSAVLLDAKDGKVLDTVFDLGAQDGLAELTEHAGQARIKLIKDWHESKSKTEEPIAEIGWIDLSDGDGKIKYVWEAAAP